jgi:hypothetical protein
MSTPCTVCQLPEKKRSRLEKRRLARTSAPTLAKEYGVSEDSIYRHMAHHVRRDVAQVLSADPPRPETPEALHGNDVLKWTRGLLGKALKYMDTAERSGDYRTALQGIREARGCVELIAKAMGELPGEGVTIQVLIVEMNQLTAIFTEAIKSEADPETTRRIFTRIERQRDALPSS